MARLTTLRPVVGSLSPRVRLAPKTAEPFYQSAAWRKVAAQAKRRAGFRCARCGSTERLIVDHIVERKDGGADFDPGNLEVLCHAHHQIKTAQARARRAQGKA